MRRCWAAAMSCLLGASAFGQQLLSDPAPFRKPALFAVPEAPTEALKQVEEITYHASIEIDDRGRAVSLQKLEPDHAEFRQRLGDAMRFWLFYPSIDPDTCAARPGQARIELRYRRDGAEPRVWVYVDPMGTLFGHRPVPRVVKKAWAPYPREELRKGLQGSVYVIVVIASDGTVEDARLLLGLPPSPGFVRAAIAGSKEIRVDPATAPRRCAVQVFDFKLP